MFGSDDQVTDFPNEDFDLYTDLLSAYVQLTYEQRYSYLQCIARNVLTVFLKRQNRSLIPRNMFLSGLFLP